MRQNRSIVYSFSYNQNYQFIYNFIGDWKTELLEYIDEDNLPEYYGGKCRDPDGNPKCKTKVF